MELQVSTIESKIYEIRGRRVMIDYDLAEMYQVPTKRLKEQVRRNIERFPGDFMFELTQKEFDELVANCDHMLKHSYITPLAFTQEGAAMLSGILRSPIAIQANISIMRAFVKLRELAMHTLEIKQLAQDNADIRRLLEEFIEETEGKFDDVYVALAHLAIQRQLPSKPRNPIGFKRSNE